MDRTQEFLDLVERLNGAARLMEETNKVVTRKQAKGNKPMAIEITIRNAGGMPVATLNAEDLTPEIGGEILEAIEKAHEFWTEQLQEIAAELIEKDTTKDEGPQADPEWGPIEQIKVVQGAAEGPSAE